MWLRQYSTQEDLMDLVGPIVIRPKGRGPERTYDVAYADPTDGRSRTLSHWYLPMAIELAIQQVYSEKKLSREGRLEAWDD